MNNVLVVIIVAFSLNLNAQKITQISGNADFLAHQSYISVNFIYPYNIMVGNISEAEYVSKKMEKAEAASHGGGEAWLQKWNDDKVNTYNPEFLKAFNKVLKNNNIDFVAVTDEQVYCMEVKTVFIEPGYNVGVDRRNAKVSIDIIFTKCVSPDNILASYSIIKAPGISTFSSDFEKNVRLAEAYSKAGKEFARYLIKTKVLVK